VPPEHLAGVAQRPRAGAREIRWNPLWSRAQLRKGACWSTTEAGFPPDDALLSGYRGPRGTLPIGEHALPKTAPVENVDGTGEE